MTTSDAFALRAPIAKESLDRKAAAELRDAILSGSLPPGSRLTETTIASQLGLSRGTIRTALQRLVAEGLVLQNVYSSWEVVRLSSHDAWELYTLRASLESLGGRLAAENMNPANQALLSAAFDKMLWAVEHGNAKDLADSDLHFHRTIIEISGHSRLIQHFEQVQMQLRICIASANGFMPSAQSVFNEHRPLVEALRNKDAALAEKLFEEHSIFYGARLVELLKREEQTAADDRPRQGADRIPVRT